MSKMKDQDSARRKFLDMDAEMVRKDLIQGIHNSDDVTIFPAIEDLIERGLEDDVKDVLYSMLANSYLGIGVEPLDEILEHILSHCYRGGKLYRICCELQSCETLEDFIERERLLRVYVADTGEYTLEPYC